MIPVLKVEAGPFSEPGRSTISSFGAGSLDTTNVKIVGTIKPFYADDGCTATIRAAMTKDID